MVDPIEKKFNLFLKKDTVFYKSSLYLIFILLFPIYIIICKKFSYMGYFRYTGINPARLIIVIALVYVFINLNCLISNGFIRLTSTISLILYYFGELCLFICDNNVDATMVIIFTVYMFLLKKIDKVNLNFTYVNTSENFYKVLFILSIILFIPFLKYMSYINFKNLLFIDVYDTRSTFRDMGMPRFMAYVYGPLCRVIIPILIIEFVKQKKNLGVIGLTIMLVYLFLCGALKSVFMGLLSVFFFYPDNYHKKEKRFIFIILFSEIVSLVLVLCWNNLFLISLLRRVYFIPARFNNYYVDYFRDNYTNYTHSGLIFWINPYWLRGLDISHFAGQYILKTGTNANTGIFVEGFYSFGLFGALIYLLVPIMIIWFLKSINYRSEFYGIVFLYLYYFNTAILSTMLLTHGLLLFLIISFFFLRSFSKKSNNLVQKHV